MSRVPRGAWKIAFATTPEATGTSGLFSALTGNDAIGVVDPVDRSDGLQQPVEVASVAELELELHDADAVGAGAGVRCQDVDACLGHGVGHVAQQLRPVEGLDLDGGHERAVAAL